MKSTGHCMGIFSLGRTGDTMIFEFRILEKEAVKDKIKSVILDLDSKKDFDLQLKDIREKNYVLEFQKLPANK